MFYAILQALLIHYDTRRQRSTRKKRNVNHFSKKYDIPINHLDFAYIKGLKNVRELEKIYKILKSKEVGHYPELTQCAEDRLKDLSPNNRLLRKSVAAVPKDSLEKGERNSYLKDITDWKDDMEAKEALLRNSLKPIMLSNL
uniref:Sperm-associated antigen 1 n=1 Tax=Triatoma infestans TaxID=30076 RepID=A0A170YCR6_TRIIF